MSSRPSKRSEPLPAYRFVPDLPITTALGGDPSSLSQTPAPGEAGQATNGRQTGASDQERLRQIVASALDAVVTMDSKGAIVGWNPRAEEIFGWPAAEVLGRPMHEIVMPERYRQRHQAGLTRYLRTGEPHILNRRVEIVALHRSGREFPVELTVVAHAHNGAAEFSGFLRDLSTERAAQAALRASEERYRQLVEQLPGIVYTDAPGARGLYISPQIESLLGWTAEEWLSHPDRWLESLHPDDRDRAQDELAAGEASGRAFTSEYRLVARDGRNVWFRDEATPTVAADGSMLVHGVMFDVTREREVEAQLEAEMTERTEIATALAGFTGGPTPEATAAALVRELTRVRNLDIAAVYAFDGDATIPLAIKAPPGAPVAAGRPLPSARGAYLRTNAERGPWVDEWRDEPRDEPMPDDYRRAWLDIGLRATAYAPLAAAGEPYALITAGTTAELTGKALGRWIPMLLEFASVANAVLGPQLRARRLEGNAAALRDMIAAGAVRTVFQPIVRLATRQVVGYEALTRFADGSSPVQRFTEASRAGLAVELERACLLSAFAAAQSLPEGRWLSVNLSPAALPGLAEIAADVGDPQRELIIEITERHQIEDYGAARELLRRHFPEARIAVDDAGAGFASLRHIAELRPAIVKLDMELVHNVHRDPAREALIAGMVHFASESGCELIAEGIETEPERRALMRLGLKLGQGFLLGVPQAVVPSA